MARAPRKPSVATNGEPSTKMSKDAEATAAASKRTYMKQTDVPNASLDDALRLPQAIFDHYAGRATSPLHLAKALNVDPKGTQIRVLAGAAIAFGLIEGGAYASTISVTDLARRIIRPKSEYEDTIARREAVLLPRVFGDFLRHYDGHPFPRTDIALNVLEDMGVPRAKADEVLERIESCARSVGYLEDIKGKVYVSLNVAEPSGDATRFEQNSVDQLDEPSVLHEEPEVIHRTLAAPAIVSKGATMTAAFEDDQRRRRVFITHGKDQGLVEPIKKLLEYGELEPVISVERQSVSKPVPEKIMDDMRRSGAAIIHVDAERVVTDAEGNEHVILNPNVLIEIGAAMAFYGRRFILLVREGVKLPSNLQGLYEVRYPGTTLDASSTIKLLEAMKDIKNYALPTDRDVE